MSKMSRDSLVAYFDILGYQSFLKNNSALETAEKVFKLVKRAPKDAVARWSQPSLKDKSRWKDVVGSIQSLVFSDTIVVSCPLPETEHSEIHFALLAGVSTKIAISMFDCGLPVRDAITKGSFVFDETCIAGRAVVDAHTLCQVLDVAGVAFSHELSEYIDEKFKKNREDIWDRYYPYYLFPLKNQSELKTRAVAWSDSSRAGDFSSKVREAFWKWNKDIPLSADRKVINTAKMLDFFRMHFQIYPKVQLKR